MVEDVLEIGARPPPLSTAKVERLAAVTVPQERVPGEIITGIRVNEKARDWLPPELRYLCSEAYISNSVVMTVPREQTETKRVLSPGFWGRAIPLGYGIIPFKEFVGGAVMGKGGFITGEKFLSAVVRREPLYPGNQKTYSLNPWGFFGDKDAEMEIVVGNTLLDYEFRSSLPLGYAIMDLEKLRLFLKNRWREFPSIFRAVDIGLDIVKQNSDKPVFFVRVTGVTERFDKVSITTKTKKEEKIIKNRRKTEIARAARLLSTEATIFSDAFSKYLEFSQCAKDEIMPVLDRLSHRESLTGEEAQILCQLLMGISNRNADCLRRLLESGVKGPRGFYSLTNLYAVLSFDKDVDLAFFTQDYEQVREDAVTITRQVDDYRNTFSRHVSEFLRELK